MQHTRQIRSRTGHQSVIIRQVQGQAKRVTAELLDADIEEDSTVRPAWPGRGNIEQIFREAQRLRA